MGDAPATDPTLSLQDAVLRLQSFWSAQGCLLLPPCDFAVPYATLQPDAFFAILGAAPWRAAYLQPVRRPLDGRFGEHPYRLAKHLQLHVALKPPPADVQSLFLDSLRALDLDLSIHDLRFEEWAWEASSLGARGSGWHALLDGLGVTRLTFLERLAGRDLDPVSVEISYGLERLTMLLQGAADVYSVDWSAGGSEIGRLRRNDERELSRYLSEVADADDLRRRLEALGREAERCLEAGLARPAYELAISCLGPIDGLDARGVLSMRERGALLTRVRDLVVAAAELRSGEEAVE
ncbi:MAG: glycine--tRNA ligase subunit alpha [bacterium]|nr:glycine--tRNA ligase subunit alpha [bacterium]